MTTTTSTRRPPRTGHHTGGDPAGVAAPARPAKPRPSGVPKPTAKPAKATKATKASTATAPAAKSTAAARTQARRPAAPPRAPFVLLIVGLLGGALVSLLLLNTVLAQDAFELTRLQQSTKQLDQQKQTLGRDIAYEEAPAQLAQKARNYGMRPATQPAFIDGPTGNVLGGSVRPVPHAAAAAAGAAGVIGVPGAIIPGDGLPASTAPTPGAP